MSIKIAVQKLGMAIAAAVTVAFVATVGHAYTPIAGGATSNVAQVTVGGGQVAMSLAILNETGNGPAAQIGWTANVGQGWVKANQYIRVTSTLTVAGSGIQTYTDNGNATASPKFTGTFGTTGGSGLVNQSNTTQVLPTGWEIVPQGGAPAAVGDPNVALAWFYHKDHSQTDFVNAMSYIEMETSGNPPNIQFAQASFGAGASNGLTGGINDVHLEANFQNAVGGTTYKTSTLTVEVFNP